MLLSLVWTDSTLYICRWLTASGSWSTVVRAMQHYITFNWCFLLLAVQLSEASLKTHIRKYSAAVVKPAYHFIELLHLPLLLWTFVQLSFGLMDNSLVIYCAYFTYCYSMTYYRVSPQNTLLCHIFETVWDKVKQFSKYIMQLLYILRKAFLVYYWPAWVSFSISLGLLFVSGSFPWLQSADEIG